MYDLSYFIHPSRCALKRIKTDEGLHTNHYSIHLHTPTQHTTLFQRCLAAVRERLARRL